MNYYSHHIGDFDRSTRHLSRLERSIYRDLLDVYHDTEQQLTLDRAKLNRRILANSDEEATAVEQVLNEFFTETPTGWFHEAADEAIEAFHNSTSQKSAAGKASAAKKAAKLALALSGKSTSVEQPLNESGTALQLTNNQEPLTNKTKTLSEQSPDAALAEDRRKPAKRIASPEDEALAARLVGLIHIDSPSFKKPNMATWSEDIRLMREVDGRAHPEIWSLFQFVRKHSFWRTVVLSPSKLREKFDQLCEVRAAPAQPTRATPQLSDKFLFNNIDRSGDAIAAEESRKRHGIVMPADDVEIDL